MKDQAFYPDHIIEQIKSFFGNVHDMTDFYYKLYLLNGLCRQCDGRGYLQSSDEACPDCRASGDAGIWHRACIVKPHDETEETL